MEELKDDHVKFQIGFVSMRARQLGKSIERADFAAKKLIDAVCGSGIKVKERLPRKFKKSLMKTINSQL